MTMGTRTTPPCLPLVAGGYSPQRHPLVVGAALHAGAVVAQLSDALSVQWVSDGIQAASGVLTVMIYSSTLVRMSAMANPTVILIIMRCVIIIFRVGFGVHVRSRDLAFRSTVLSLQDPYCGRALYYVGRPRAREAHISRTALFLLRVWRSIPRPQY